MATTVSDVKLNQGGQVFAERAPRSLWSDARRRLLRNKAAVAGMLYILFLLIIAIAAPLLAPHNPLQIFQGSSYLPPSWDHPLGTDSIGRDVYSRLLFGSRTSLVVGFIPMIFTLLLGTTIGLIAGFRGGLSDTLLMRVADMVYSFPALLFFIIVMAALKDTPIGQFLNGFLILFMALSLVEWVSVSRLVRGQVLSLKEKEFVEAARATGVRTPSILFRHLLPNSLGPIIVSGAFIVPGAIITEATLSYLGIGLRPATNFDAPFPVSWGNMILDGKAAMTSQPWLMISPAVAIASVTLAFTFIGDGLRDALDPRDR